MPGSVGNFHVRKQVCVSNKRTIIVVIILNVAGILRDILSEIPVVNFSSHGLYYISGMKTNGSMNYDEFREI
jgi:hypothetical protein